MRFIFILCVFILALNTANALTSTWTIDGQQYRLTLEAVEGRYAVMRNSDGKQFKIFDERFSSTDIHKIQHWMRTTIQQRPPAQRETTQNTDHAGIQRRDLSNLSDEELLALAYPDPSTRPRSIHETPARDPTPPPPRQQAQREITYSPPETIIFEGILLAIGVGVVAIVLQRIIDQKGSVASRWHRFRRWTSWVAFIGTIGLLWRAALDVIDGLAVWAVVTVFWMIVVGLLALAVPPPKRVES